jgi:hypothetical protein
VPFDLRVSRHGVGLFGRLDAGAHEQPVNPFSLPLVGPFLVGMFDVPGKGAQVVIIALLVERWQVSPGLDGVLFIRVGARAWKRSSHLPPVSSRGPFDRAGKEVLPRRLGEAGRAAHELEQQAQGSRWRYGQR